MKISVYKKSDGAHGFTGEENGSSKIKKLLDSGEWDKTEKISPSGKHKFIDGEWVLPDQETK